MSPLLDGENIILRLARLKEYLKILKSLQKFSLAEIQTDPFKKGALLHYLQLSAEVCIDIGEMIIVAENFEVPADSAEIFITLGAGGVLGKQFAAHFAPVARFRNLIVHEYIKIDIEKVYHYLQHELGQFNLFAAAIVRYVKKKK